MFERYKNLSGRSSIECFEIGLDYIAMAFKGLRQLYVYPLSMLGNAHFSQMAQLAKRGQGLRSYVYANCNKAYSHALMSIGGTTLCVAKQPNGLFHARVDDRYKGSIYSFNQLSIDEAIKNIKAKAGLPKELTLGSFCQVVWTPSPIEDGDETVFTEAGTISR